MATFSMNFVVQNALHDPRDTTALRFQLGNRPDNMMRWPVVQTLPIWDSAELFNITKKSPPCSNSFLRFWKNGQEIAFENHAVDFEA
jgi:hypothetical protein